MLLSVLLDVKHFNTKGTYNIKKHAWVILYLLLKSSNAFSEAVKALPWLARSNGSVKMTSFWYLSNPGDCKENTMVLIRLNVKQTSFNFNYMFTWNNFLLTCKYSMLTCTMFLAISSLRKDKISKWTIHFIAWKNLEFLQNCENFQHFMN